MTMATTCITIRFAFHAQLDPLDQTESVHNVGMAHIKISKDKPPALIVQINICALMENAYVLPVNSCHSEAITVQNANQARFPRSMVRRRVTNVPRTNTKLNQAKQVVLPVQNSPSQTGHIATIVLTNGRATTKFVLTIVQPKCLETRVFANSVTRVNITMTQVVQIVRGGTSNPPEVQWSVLIVRPDTVGRILHIVQDAGKISKLLISIVQTVNLARIYSAIPAQIVPWGIIKPTRRIKSTKQRHFVNIVPKTRTKTNLVKTIVKIVRRAK